jgi:hypothetical protein
MIPNAGSPNEVVCIEVIKAEWRFTKAGAKKIIFEVVSDFWGDFSQTGGE